MAIASALTARTGDAASGTTGPSRAGSDLSAYVLPITNKELFSADEGSYISLFTPTSGTGIIGHAAPTTYDQTKPYLVIYNGVAGRTFYPQFIDLNETVAGVGGTGVTFVPSIDVGNLITTPGTTLTVANSSPANGISTTGLVAQVGAIVCSAATSAVVQYGDVVFRGTTIDIIGDHYSMIFGAPSSNGGASSKVATLIDSSRILAPLAVPFGYMLKIVQWRASQSTGPTWQVRMGGILR